MAGAPGPRWGRLRAGSDRVEPCAVSGAGGTGGWRACRLNSRMESVRPVPKWFHQARFHSQVWNGDGTASRPTSWFHSVRMASNPSRVVTSRTSMTEETAAGARWVIAIASADPDQPAGQRPGRVLRGGPREFSRCAAVEGVGGKLDGEDPRGRVGQRTVALGQLQLPRRCSEAVGEGVEHRAGDDVAAEDGEVRAGLPGGRLL